MYRPLFALVLSGCGSAPADPVLPDPTSPTSPTTGDTGTLDTDTDSGSSGLDCSDVLEEVDDLLAARCAACHGPGSPSYAGFGDALDPGAMITDGWVVPADAGGSRIMIAVEAGTMPPANGGGALSEDEKAVLRAWIDCGAEDWGVPASTRGFLSPDMEYGAALDDVRRLSVVDNGDDPDQGHARYLSLVPLYNSGVAADRIALYGSALHKLVLSLTVEDTRSPLVPVDLDGFVLPDGTPVRVADGLGASLLFRVDLEEFGWDNAGQDVDAWEELVKAYPFAVPLDDEIDAAEELTASTKTRVPIVHGDWFAGNASLPPLYFDVLDVPHTFDAFMSQFGEIADVQADFDQNRVDCAGMDESQSLVSQSNRVICRHAARNGYCWESFDFASSAGVQDIFANPIDFPFVRDGGEAFCSLSSGQQVYLVYDAAGNRIDNAPIAVVSDYNLDSGGEVRTGLSCIRCHELGVMERDDQVRAVLEAFPQNYDDAELEQALEWYKPANELADVYATDISAFEDALDAIAVPVGEEPVWALSLSYDAGLDAARAAAELGLAEGDLVARLGANAAIQVQYQSLLVPGGTLSRDAFEAAARDTICDLQIGDVCDEAAFCGVSAVPCPDGSVCDALGQCTKVD